VQRQYLCKGWCYGGTTVSWSPMLVFELKAKKFYLSTVFLKAL